MADDKIIDLPADASPAAADLIETVDVSDTTDNPAGSSKKVTLAKLPLSDAATTAIAGLQSDLDGKQPSGSYATAAQGTKADSATQPADLADYASLSPAASLAHVADRRPGLIPPTGFDRVAPVAYLRFSAVDSVQYSNLVGGGGGGVAAIPGERVGQVNDVATGSARYGSGSRFGLGVPAGGPTLVEVNGHRYWDSRPGDAIAASLSLAGDCTLSILCRPRRYDFDGLFNFDGDGSQLHADGGRIDWYNLQPAAQLLAGRPGVDVAVVVRVRSEPSRRLEVFLDGVRVVDATDPSTDALAATALLIGSVYTTGYSWFDGLIAEVVFHDSALSDVQVSWMSQALLARATAPDVEAAPLGVNLVVEGNSLSDPLAGLTEGNWAGFGPHYPATQQWPAQLAARHPSWSITNLAVSSRRTAPVGGDDNGGNVISPTFAAHLTAYHDPDKINVLVLWEGINHLGIGLSGAGSGQVAAQALLDLGTVAVAAGWRVVIGTLTNRADGGVTNGSYATEYLAANAYLRTHGAGTAYHALADLGGDDRFQDPDDGLYILASDHVHFTLLGQAVAQAEFFGPAIAAVST